MFSVFLTEEATLVSKCICQSGLLNIFRDGLYLKQGGHFLDTFDDEGPQALDINPSVPMLLELQASRWILPQQVADLLIVYLQERCPHQELCVATVANCLKYLLRHLTHHC
jgi:hypothetical protein